MRSNKKSDEVGWTQSVPKTSIGAREISRLAV
jgi:hypothetical protein